MGKGKPMKILKDFRHEAIILQSGLFGGSTVTPVAPVAPVQSNTGSFAPMMASMEQNNLLLQQMQQTQEMQMSADMAEAENLRELELREAEAEAEQSERALRMSKGKRDLLYNTALGVTDDDEQESGLLALGGDQ